MSVWGILNIGLHASRQCNLFFINKKKITLGACNEALNLHVFGVVHTFPKNVQLLYGYVTKY